MNTANDYKVTYIGSGKDYPITDIQSSAGDPCVVDGTLFLPGDKGLNAVYAKGAWIKVERTTP